MFGKEKRKKEVIAYLHTHWDREWYREFEILRLRLAKVFDHVLDMLDCGKIPSFYFDGQVVALLDYLEIRPEKEELVRKLISKKKLFIGPFYCLVDEFLTDSVCFHKNLEMGLTIAQEFGCSDFIGYLADTFGHSANTPVILKEYGIDKAVVWRGCPDNIPADFVFNGVNTVNLVRGYYMDIFSSNDSLEDKAKRLKENLDIIAKKSKDVLLLPIGADHLDIPDNITEQIFGVNKYLADYEIHLGTPFEYFDKVKFTTNYNSELRDNSNTFILPGSYSSRLDLKRLNALCSYKLEFAHNLQVALGNEYAHAIDYAYKLLLQNQAHDSICGCSTDDVHAENIVRYKKILQICDAIIEQIRQTRTKDEVASFENENDYKILEVERDAIEDDAQVVSIRTGVPSNLLYNTGKIPVTEDFVPLYTMLKEFNSKNKPSDLGVNKDELINSKVRLYVKDGAINVSDGKKEYKNFIEFVRVKDDGDTYNFAPDKSPEEKAKILNSKVLLDGELRCTIRVITDFFNVDISLDKLSKLLKFKIKWLNLYSDSRWQVRFNFDKNVKEVFSEDMNSLISRKFDFNYDISENLPDTKGKEAKTNTAPIQRFCWTNGLGIITIGLTEYEVYKNTLSVTLLRSTGIISNPKNPARTTPAGPPIKVPEAQMVKENIAEFAIGFFPVKDWQKRLEEIYTQSLVF